MHHVRRNFKGIERPARRTINISFLPCSTSLALLCFERKSVMSGTDAEYTKFLALKREGGQLVCQSIIKEHEQLVETLLVLLPKDVPYTPQTRSWHRFHTDFKIWPKQVTQTLCPSDIQQWLPKEFGKVDCEFRLIKDGVVLAKQLVPKSDWEDFLPTPSHKDFAVFIVPPVLGMPLQFNLDWSVLPEVQELVEVSN